jgi:hypothetical protein
VRTRALPIHIIGAFLGIAFLMFLSTENDSPLSGDLTRLGGPLVDIGVEHELPLALKIETSTLPGGTLIEIINDDKEEIFVSVPSIWEKREVRNVPLSSVRSDDPSFGFRRWHLPARAALSLRSAEAHKRFLVHNPSGAAMKVHFITVNLETEESRSEVVFIQESPIEL